MIELGRHHIAKISSIASVALDFATSAYCFILLSNLLKKLAPVLSTGIIGLTTILSICLAFNHWQIEPTLIKGNWFKIWYQSIDLCDDDRPINVDHDRSGKLHFFLGAFLLHRVHAQRQTQASVLRILGSIYLFHNGYCTFP